MGGGGGGGGSSAPSVRGHEACLLPCHGPCAASNQSSSASCRGFNRNQDRRSSASSATELGGNNYSAAAHEAHVALARRTPHRVLISETNTLARTTHWLKLIINSIIFFFRQQQTTVMAARNRPNAPQKSKRGQQARAEDARNARKQVRNWNQFPFLSQVAIIERPAAMVASYCFFPIHCSWQANY